MYGAFVSEQVVIHVVPKYFKSLFYIIQGCIINFYYLYFLRMLIVYQFVDNVCITKNCTSNKFKCIYNIQM